MKEELLELTPKRFLCPYCGEWHEWNKIHALRYYNSSGNSARFKCSNTPSGYDAGDYRIFFEGGYCYYTTESRCGRAYLALEGKIEIASITESIDKHIVTFGVPFKPHDDVGSEPCAKCAIRHVCNVVNLADKGYFRVIEINLGFEFDYDELERRAIARCEASEMQERELKECENSVKSKEQSLQERKSALKIKEVEKRQHQEQHTKQQMQDWEIQKAVQQLNQDFCRFREMRERERQERENSVKIKEQSLY